MGHHKHQVSSGEDLFFKIDLHKHMWHVTTSTAWVNFVGSLELTHLSVSPKICKASTPEI
jgi:hypothetical protein